MVYCTSLPTKTPVGSNPTRLSCEISSMVEQRAASAKVARSSRVFRSSILLYNTPHLRMSAFMVKLRWWEILLERTLFIFWYLRSFTSTRRYRYRKYIEYWNSRADDIAAMIRNDDREQTQVTITWIDLIDQEIRYWINQGFVSDFDWLAERRGFSADQQKLMREIIDVIGLKYR